MHAAADYHGIEGMRDTDAVITTRELARWAKQAEIRWDALEDSAYDSLMDVLPARALFSEIPAASWKLLCAQLMSTLPAAPHPIHCTTCSLSAAMRACAKPACLLAGPYGQRCGCLRHSERQKTAAQHQSGRKAVPLHRSDGLPRRLHRRRRSAEKTLRAMPIKHVKAVLRRSIAAMPECLCARATKIRTSKRCTNSSIKSRSASWQKKCYIPCTLITAIF